MVLQQEKENGKIIPGLEYGNSPSDYTPEFIANKIMVLTTTNGQNYYIKH